jgi:predicted dehydrogenase
MQRLTIGVIGCGLIAQVEHLPYLLALPDHFEVVGLVDPSA